MISLLNDLTMEDRDNYGTKAVILGELSRTGLQVPKGFAISTAVYLEFLKFNQFTYKAEDYHAQNENIIDFILKGSFTKEIISPIKHCFESLNLRKDNKCFVVRSSATCEDIENYSMAGVFSSYINLVSYSQLFESIKKCYASLFSDKALSMMIRYNIPLKDLKMGIIVQEFIDGNLSGVAFSADTVKMDSETIIINSVNSTCADYVEGKKPSSQYRLTKATCEVINSLVPAQTPQLSKDELYRLHKDVLFIEKSLGYHQDIEWTIKDSNLYILQARPITTFRSRNYPESLFKYNDLNDTLILSDDKALTPLEQDIKVLWFNATCKGWEYSSKGRNGRFKIWNGYFFYAVDERDWDKRAKFRDWLTILFLEGKNIFQDIQLPQIISLREELKYLFQKELTISDLISILSKSIQLFELSVEANISAVDGSPIPLDAFEKYCRSIDPGLTKEDFYDLVYGISKLSEERQTVINMALYVKSNPELVTLFDTCRYDEILYHHLKYCGFGLELLESIDEYIKEYGLMTVNGQWKFDSPIIMEQPWHVLGKIRACIDIDTDLFFHSRMNSLTKKKSVIEKLTANMSDEEKAEFLSMLRGAEKAFLVNDDHCFYLDLSAVGYMRLALIKIVDLLVHKGIIERNQDIDFLKYDEIRNFLIMIQEGNTDIKYQNVVNKRRDEYNFQSRIIPPSYIGIQPVLRTSQEVKKSEDSLIVIKGVSGLQKKVAGKVKVVTDNNNINLNEAVILVLKHGHSCYFLPYLNKIKGLIYDGGSPYDHPGIIARELSIPSLYNTQDATKILKDGDEIELDGINECVILKNEQSKQLP